MKIKEVGFVISLVQYKDYDAMVNVLTKNGKIAFKARGILKPTSKNAPSCQLFCLSEFIINQNQNRNTLINAASIKKVKNLIENPKLATYLSFLSEIINKSEEKFSPYYFEYFNQLIDLFNEGYNDLLTLTLITLTRVMENEGIGLNVDECSICGNKEEITTVSYENGGFLCYKCSNNIDDEVDYLKYFRYTVLANIDNVSKFSVPIEVGKKLLREYFDYIENSIGVFYRHRKVLEMIF
ncbi:TPA: DNA repair protein RecO [bacterium]|nr:DNA repair protein RecO [bacterium]